MKKEPIRPECHPDRKHKAKGLCFKCYTTAYTKNSPVKKNITKQWAINNKHRISELDRRYSYGLEPSDYTKMFNSQNGQCLICENTLRAGRHTTVDHDHVTGAVRAILCRYCNSALGLFNEDTIIMQSAIKYLSNIGVYEKEI